MKTRTHSRVLAACEEALGAYWTGGCMFCYDLCKCCDYHENTAGDQTLVSSLYTVTLLTDLSPFTVTKQYATELRA
jgi:hypothetical protein